MTTATVITKTRREYVRAVLEGRLATADYLLAYLPSTAVVAVTSEHGPSASGEIDGK